MKKGASLLFGICVFTAQMSVAQNQAPGADNTSLAVLVQGVDVTPLIEEINKNIVTLKKSVLVYHWFQGNPGSLWTQPLSAASPYGYQYVHSSAQTYWKDYGNDIGGNLYGRGLYAALDPVATREYGEANWVLTQIQFPKGLRVLDIKTSGYSQLPQKAQAVLNALKCTQTQNLDTILKGGGPESPECKRSLKEVLKDKVQFQALLYTYGSNFFDECTDQVGSMRYPSPRRQSAFVIVDSSWIQKQSVKVFNSKTSDDPENRALILSLFYEADHDATKPENKSFGSGILTQMIYQHFQKHYPGYLVAGMQQQCSGGMNNCVNTYKLMKLIDGKQQEIEVPEPQVAELSYPSKMTQEQVPRSSYLYGMSNGLLWTDMEGHPTVSNLNQWIDQNLYGCSAVEDEIIKHGK